MPCIVDVKNDRLYIKFTCLSRDMFYEKLDQVKGLYDRSFNDKDRSWNASITENNIELLKGYGFEFINEAKKLLGKDYFKLSDRYLPDIDENLLDDRLYPFQIEGVRFLEGRNGLGGLFDDMGCIDGEAIIQINRAGKSIKYKLKDLYIKFNGLEKSNKYKWDRSILTYARCYKNDLDRIRLNQIVNVLYKGKRKVLHIKTKSGKELKLTPDHKLLTKKGWIEINKLKVGDNIFINGENICKKCGSNKNVVIKEKYKFCGYCKKCIYKYLRKQGRSPDIIKRRKGKDGYIYLIGRPVKYHHRRSTSGVLEHVYIMENYLGRKIDFENERIHHKNEIRDDNRIENLEIVSKSEHKIKHKAARRFGNFKHGRSENIVITIPKLEEIIIKKELKKEIDVYDIVMRDPYRNFIANNIIVHNCGKTVQSLMYLKLHPELRPALIICPATLKLNWEKEIRMWLGNKEKIELLYGKSFYEINCDSTILIMNYEILGKTEIIEKEVNGEKKKIKILSNDSWCFYLREIGIKIIIADECQRISGHKNICTKSFIKIKKKIKRFIPLSGTPIKNRPSEFFTVLNMLDPIIFNNRWSYLQRFCNPKFNGFSYVYKGLTNGDELFKLIHPLMIRRKKEDVLKELPPKTTIIVPLECNKIELEKYLKAYKEIFEKDPDKKIEMRNEIEFLKQLTYVAKRDFVIDWIKTFLESDEKLVLFAIHRKVLDDIQKEFKDVSVRIDGSINLKDRQKAIEDFQKKDKIKLFLGQIRAAGEGITLTASRSVVFIELDWNPATHHQAEDRTHRISQESDAVFIYYLIANGTIENDIIDILQEKGKMLGKVLDGKENDFIDGDIYNDLMGRIENK